MEYRNDLEAARLRINTLEAKLEESKASLDARDAELAECRTERNRLRQTGKAPPPRNRLFGYVAIAFLAGILATAATTSTIAVFTTSSPSTNFKSEGPVVEGPTNIPPEEPLPPKAKEEGRIVFPAQEPPTPAATIAGPTNDADADAERATIASIVEGVRPKIQHCYRDETKQHPQAHGSLTVVFDIEPSGKVSRVKLESLRFVDPWWSKTFETCVVGVYRTLAFSNTGDTKTTASAKYFLTSHDLGF